MWGINNNNNNNNKKNFFSNNNIIFSNNNKVFQVNNFFNKNFFSSNNFINFVYKKFIFINEDTCIYNNKLGLFNKKKNFFHKKEICELCDDDFKEDWNIKKLDNGFEIECQDEFNLKDLNRWTSKVKCNVIDLRILMLNIQHLNIEEMKLVKKRKYIIDNINELNPDIIFLMDTGKNDINLLNFKKYEVNNDGNNSLLFVHNAIIEEVFIVQGIFILRNLKIAFSYLKPNFKNILQGEKLFELNLRNYAIYGDVNSKSNKDWYKRLSILQINGEDSKQTLVINDFNVIRAMNYDAPSDHKLVLIITKKMCHNTNRVILRSIEDEYDFVDQIFGGKFPTVKARIDVEKINTKYTDKDGLWNDLICALVDNKVTKIYNYYGNTWRERKKEPFLGTKCPRRIVLDFKSKYEHNKGKKYLDIEIDKVDGKIFNYEDIKVTRSKAINFDTKRLNKIAESTLVVFGPQLEDLDADAVEDLKINDEDEDWIKESKKAAMKYLGVDEMQTIDRDKMIKNFLNYCNVNKDKLVCKTFFLMKNKLLRDIRDVRTIVIIPSVMKILESIIYKDIFRYLSKHINNEVKYQYGGTINGSTFEAFFVIQSKFKQDDRGILFVDFVRGYDSIIWPKLHKFINERIKDDKIKTMLNIWYIIMHNMDIEMSGDIIKKEKGIAMGLSLSPIIFDFYVHEVLKDVNIELDHLVMYIDDLAVIIPKEMNNNKFTEFWDKLMKEVSKYGLIVSKSKTSCLTEDIELQKMLKKEGINSQSKEKYLGIKLEIEKGILVNSDENFFENLLTKRNLWFGSLAMQRLMCVGGLDAKLRYNCMMLPLEEKILRHCLWKKCYFFFKKEYYMLSYLQVSILSWNNFRYCINVLDMRKILQKLQRHNVGEIAEEIKSKLYCDIEQVDNIIKKMSFDLIEIINLREEREIEINEKLCGGPFSEDNETAENDGEIEELFSFRWCNEIINRWWSKFIEEFINNWIFEKKQRREIIYENISIIAEKRFFKNIRIMQDLIFGHIPKFECIIVYDKDWKWMKRKFGVYKLIYIFFVQLLNNLKKYIHIDNNIENDFNNLKKINNFNNLINGGNDCLADINKEAQQEELDEMTQMLKNFKIKFGKELDWVYEESKKIAFFTKCKAWMEEFRKISFEMADYLYKIETNKKKKNSFKEVYAKLLILDAIYADKKYEGLDVEELVFITNLKFKERIEKAYEVIYVESLYIESHDLAGTSFWDNASKEHIKNHIISVDGSFSTKNNKVGIGFAMRENEEDEVENYYACYEGKYDKYKHITGEFFATILSIETAIAKGWNEVNLIYDYLGIGKLIEDDWRANTALTAWFKRNIKKLQKKIEIYTYKVRSHVGDIWNERADKLAKYGCERVGKCDGIELKLDNWLKTH